MDEIDAGVIGCFDGIVDDVAFGAVVKVDSV